MNRFLHYLLSALSLALLIITGGAAAQTNASEFKEGVEYQRIKPAQPTVTGDKVEVRELFWYGCSHCFTLEPYMEQWLKNKPDYVEFVRTPAVFGQRWVVHARAYFTAEALGVVERIHEPLFAAIHKKKQRMDTAESLEQFFAGHGVAPEDFRKAFRSFAVEGKIKQAEALGRKYGVTGVPAVIVAGKYRTDGPMAGDYANLIRIIEFLAQKEAEGSS